MHLEHEFLHSHDGHAQEVHPHDLHVVASGHAQLSGPQASQSFGQHAIVAGRSEVRRGMAKRGCASVGRTDFRGRSDEGLVGAPRVCVPAKETSRARIKSNMEPNSRVSTRSVGHMEPHYLDCIL